MLPLLIPLLSLLVGFSKAEEVTKFTEVVEVRFIAKMNPTNSWTDITVYDPPDPNHILSQPFTNQQDSAVGSMRFLGPNDKKSARLFTWSPSDRPIGKNVSLGQPSALAMRAYACSVFYLAHGRTGKQIFMVRSGG